MDHQKCLTFVGRMLEQTEIDAGFCKKKTYIEQGFINHIFTTCTLYAGGIIGPYFFFF